jgi:hypothetical protein
MLVVVVDVQEGVIVEVKVVQAQVKDAQKSTSSAYHLQCKEGAYLDSKE